MFPRHVFRKPRATGSSLRGGAGRCFPDSGTTHLAVTVASGCASHYASVIKVVSDARGLGVGVGGVSVLSF